MLSPQRCLTPLGILLFLAGTASASFTQVENSKPGTDRWRIANPAFSHEIEGYASKTSVARGDSIDLFVHTIDPEYTIEIFRMGWYRGLGGRKMLEPIQRPGIRQPMPEPDPLTGLIECRWSDPVHLEIPRTADPTEWMTGVYLGRLTALPSKKQSYLTFVVRDDERPVDLLFQSSVTTFQAYNSWGGKSLYAHSSSGQPARKVSFNRPYVLTAGLGAGNFLNNGGWEYNMVRWLERSGYETGYTTNVDIHVRPETLQKTKAFLSVGHDEYWSWEMRSNIAGARDSGVHIGFFSANTCYWQIRLESSSTGERDRTIVAYKDFAATEDPVLLDRDPSNDSRATVKWRQVPVSRPEAELIGVQYVYNPVNGDIIVSNAGHRLFAATGLQNGDALAGVLGYEVDRTAESSPRNIEVLARSPFRSSDGSTAYSEMTVYQSPSGAWVFATGTIQWSWGLDSFNAPDARPDVTSRHVAQVTRNVLSLFGAEPAAPRRRPAGK